MLSPVFLLLIPKIKMQKGVRLSSGFTLIEVLIAVVLLAIGLLGLAGLQASALRNNQNAYFRSVATQFAYNIADRIRANRVEAKRGSASTYLNSPTDAKSKATCLTTAGCTPAEMAENDLYLWNLGLTKELPLGNGSIAYASGVYTITVNWDENKDGDTTNDPSLQISFI